MIDSGKAEISIKSCSITDECIEAEIYTDISEIDFRCLCPAIIVAYDSEGRIAETTIENIKFGANTIFANFPIELNEGYTYKLMLWNSMNRMQAIADAVIPE